MPNMRLVVRSPIAVALLMFSVQTAHAESNWPRWRGPEQNGHSTETDLPVKWSDANLAWKIG